MIRQELENGGLTVLTLSLRRRPDDRLANVEASVIDKLPIDAPNSLIDTRFPIYADYLFGIYYEINAASD
jgi:hypothetical protein